MCTGMAEAAVKGGVSPLVLFTGVTGNRQEAAHREVRLRLCGMMTGGRCQVMPNTVPRAPTHKHTFIRTRTGSSGQLRKLQPQQSTVCKITTCAQVPLQPPPPCCQPNPTWGLCSNERPHRGFISSDIVCSALCWMQLLP